MELKSIAIQIVATALLACCVLPGGISASDAFIGAGIDMSNHLGDTINFNLNPAVQAAGIAYGVQNLDMGITWGVDYDIASLAGYPYGYGAVGAVTDANIGYSLGLSLDETHAAGFDGSAFGIPLQEGTSSTTSYNDFIAANDHLQSTQASLVF